MEKREVKFSLVFRDMWQSAGKYVPRASLSAVSLYAKQCSSF